MPLNVSSTMCSSSEGQKLYYTASGIITPIGASNWLITKIKEFLSLIQNSKVVMFTKGH